jgi:uncharacterized membrane protein YuzA (DUF378 family)
MKFVHTIAFSLLVIGGVNWGLAIWNYDIATWGLPMGLVNVVYALVALSAIYEVATHGKRCKECRNEMSHTGGM